MPTRVYFEKEHEVCTPLGKDGYQLCLQWACYKYDSEANDFPENGYRFIWRKPPNGNLMATRGQARIPSLAVAKMLIELAELKGWGNEGKAGEESKKMEAELALQLAELRRDANR